ncbi:hypothetical protein SAMN05421840_102372 [Shewanella morhuae]|nr:hypothetical protein [Shewanella morhuae]SIQ61340.1 hypothetical protein SAMN05421840_102372 [Shewanella morhuae]
MTASLRSYVRLSVTAIMIGGGAFLSGCASSPEAPLGCGTVSGYLQPDASTHWYRVVVTHLNGQAVVSKPNYQLAPGEYEFTVAELIDDPNLSVTVTARVPKVLKLNIQSHQRYHLGALLHTDKRYMGKDTAYWEPGVWLQEQHECQFELSPETK